MANIFSLYGNIFIDNQKANQSIDDSTKKASSFSKKMDELGKKATNLGRKMTLGLTLPIVGLTTVGVAYNSSMETLTASFKTMTGSAEEAGNIMTRIKEIAKTTPFETQGLAETTQLLMNYGLTADDAINQMRTLGDISQGSAEKMNRIATAYGQMSSAGKVSLQDVKQMIEAGFNPLNEISTTTGESMSSLYDRISKGTISVDEITASMQRSTAEGGKYFGSMSAQSQTTSGKLSTLKDSFNEATGALTVSLIPVLQSGIDLLTKLSDWFGNLNEGQQKTILTVLGFIAAIGPLLSIIGFVIDKLPIIIYLVKSVGMAMTFMASPIGIVIAIIASLVATIMYVWKNWEAFSTGFKYILNGIGNATSSVFKGVVNTIIGAVNTVTRVINGLMQGVLAPFNAIIWGLNQVPRC